MRQLEANKISKRSLGVSVGIGKSLFFYLLSWYLPTNFSQCGQICRQRSQQAFTRRQGCNSLVFALAYGEPILLLIKGASKCLWDFFVNYG